MAISRGKNAAFTLPELLVVITVAGVLMGLLFPAVNSIRESMRRVQCKNNLTQLGKAARLHLTAQGWFPSDGWGSYYQGDPDHGFGGEQPGGWIYNILPYMGLDMIHDIGKGLPPGPPSYPNKYNALAEAEAAPIPGVICPARRKVMAYPIALGAAAQNAAVPTQISKTDYAVNGGSFYYSSNGPSPVIDTSTYTVPCVAVYPNCKRWSNPDQTYFTGVSGERSEVSQIPDGESNVFLAGEKYLDPNSYYSGQDKSDNHSCLEGQDIAVARWVSSVPGVYMPPTCDTPGNSGPWMNFGSAHPAGLHFVFCDGSVKLLSYSIDLPTYQSLGTRNGGMVSENF